MLFSVNFFIPLLIISSLFAQKDCSYIDFAAEHLVSYEENFCKAFFVPQPKPHHNDMKHILLGLVNAEQYKIEAALFRLNDLELAQALCQAQERGVQVSLVLDWSAFGDRAHKCDMVKDAGVDVRKYTSPATMHNKFIIFYKNLWDKHIVWTGSANMTISGLSRNEENVIVTDQDKFFQEYTKRFVYLIDKTKKLDEVNQTYQEKIKINKPYTAGFLPSFSYTQVHAFVVKSLRSIVKLATRVR